MKTQARKRFTPLASVLLIVGVLSLACFLWVRAEQRQYAMNRELIASLASGDVKRALKLVEAGADPNTWVKLAEAPSWREFFGQLLHHSPERLNNSPTAFMAVCGDVEILTSAHSADYAIPFGTWDDPRFTVLQKSMLHHGANVNARDAAGATALMGVASHGFTERMTVLLQNGAAIDLQDNAGYTALYYAVLSDDLTVLKILLKNHADVHIKNRDGVTAYSFAGFTERGPHAAQFARLLKAAGGTE